MISYYDIRDARTAMRALQNKPLRRRKLDIHFSIPKVGTMITFFSLIYNCYIFISLLFCYNGLSLDSVKCLVHIHV